MRRAGLSFSLLFLFFGCRSTPSSFRTQSQNINLDSAIIEGAKYLISRLSPGSKVSIVNIQSPTLNLTNYIIDNVSVHLVNEDSFFVIERSELGAIQKEQKNQLSGEVSDETAVSIGHQLGTQFIITGSILPLGSVDWIREKR